MIQRILLALVVAIVLGTILVFSQQRSEPLKVSGFIEADEIRLGSRVGGRVAKVNVQEGSEVAASDVLLELEPFDLQEQLARAEAEMAARKAELDKLQKGFRDEEIAQAAARVKQLEARLLQLKNGPRAEELKAAEARLRLSQEQIKLAQQQHTRNISLRKKNAISQDQFDESYTRLQVAIEEGNVRASEFALLQEGTRPEAISQAEAELEQAKQALKLSQTGFRVEEIAQADAAYQAAAANADAIKDQIQELHVTASVGGIVDAIELQPGDLVGPNVPVISIIDTSHLWVRTYVPADRMAIQVGKKVKIGVDSYPDESFEGHISFIAREAEFTPGNVQTPEERSKRVFRIKVILDTGLDKLLPGMIADVYLDEQVQQK